MKCLLRSTGVVLVFTMTMGAGTVSAAVVTQWDYSADLSFTDAVFGAGGGVVNGAGGDPDYELSWGAAGGDFMAPTGDSSQNRSALTIGNGDTGALTGGGPTTGTVDTVIGAGLPTGSEIGVTANITHWNNAINITDFATLDSGTLRATLNLTPTMPGPGLPVDAPDVVFDFFFVETSNSGPCPGGATPCGDLFGLASRPLLNQLFTYDGNEYLASLLVSDGMGGASPVGALLDAECAALGLSNGCQGWRTEEFANTTVQFTFAVSTEDGGGIVDIPEPTSLALLSLGLAGIGYTRRRNVNKLAA